MGRFLIPLLLLGVCLVGCRKELPLFTVSEVWEEAVELDGRQIRVQGQSRFRLLPHHPMQVGGCVVGESDIDDSVTSEFMLVDENNEERPLVISNDSVQCTGDSCSVTCTPFSPAPGLGWSSNETVTAFELVGTLQVQEQDGSRTLTLTDLDLPASSRFNEGVWESIPTGEFTSSFP